MEAFFNIVAGYGVFILQFLIVITIVLWLLRGIVDVPLVPWIQKNSVWIGCVIAFGGILGSLIYSDVIGYVPCLLCWWQRVLLYPQFIILLVAGITREYTTARITGLVMSIIGIGISILHILDQAGVLGNSLACDRFGSSCQEIAVVLHGYITIPVMAFTLFAALILVHVIGLVKKN